MYESYWQLERRPFDPGADPRSYYPGEPHQAALLKLRYAIESRSGAALLAGPSGTGKTLLVRLLAEQLPKQYTPFVHLVFPQMPAHELLAFLAAELHSGGDERPRATLADHIGSIQRHLYRVASQDQHAVIVIDDAQLLDGSAALDTLRLLMNFESGGRPALTLLFVGQPSLLPQFKRLPQLDDRLGPRCVLRPFLLEESMSYIEHRLKLAGARRSIFESSALEAVHHAAHGIPRLINRLCDLALLVGFAEELPSISAEHVQAVAEELAGVGVE